jgi:hypothetical protein
VLITSVTSSHAANLYNFKKLPYDPVKDFAPVATLQRSYFILMVRPEAPWKTVNELTAAMKEKGAKASYGYGSPPAWRPRSSTRHAPACRRSASHTAPRWRRCRRCSAASSTSSSSTRPRARRWSPPANYARLAVTSASVCRASTFRPWRSGRHPEFDIAPTWGVFLPAGAPAPIVAQLEDWFLQIVRMDATKAFLANTNGAPTRRLQGAGRIPAEGNQEMEELAKLAKIEPQ